MKKGKKNKVDVKKMVLASLFAALIYVATTIIAIRTPMGGYFNLGDCFILLGAWLLGPYYGFFAGGIGSALADLLAGYSHYIVGTFVIKGLMAVVAAGFFKTIHNKLAGKDVAALAVSGLAAEILMVVGYFSYEAWVLGYGLASVASMPGNVMQGLFGLVAGIVLHFALRIPLARVNL